MASQGVAASTSRLAQMQMRFQQKQLQEREQKKLALTTGDVANNNNPVAARNAIGNGKVREMFERRRGVGIDRSHPLKPISSTTSTISSTSTASHRSTNMHQQQQQQQPAAMRRLPGGANASTRRPVITTKHTTSNMRNSHSHPDAFASNGNLFGRDLDEMDNLESETFPKEFSSLSLDNTRIMGAAVHDGNNNLNKSTNGIGRRDIMDTTITISKRPNTNGIKLNPVITKKSPNANNVGGGSRTSSQVRTPQSSAGGGGRTFKTPPPRSTTSTNGGGSTTITKSPIMKKPTTVSTTGAKGIKKTTKAVNGKAETFVLAVKPPPRVVTPPPGMSNCQFCLRNFNEDRLEKHQEVCRKITVKKRKIFDASKHRVQGTEAEKFVPKPPSKANATAVRATITATASTPSAADGKKSNWRKKHEEFINAIREAKKVQAYLAKGGKLSDLPPPPPSENPDYVQCPHCSRRFNQTAAERHIPKCANMKHNKPKPPVQKKRY